MVPRLGFGYGVPIAESESRYHIGGRSEVPKFLAPPPQTRSDSARHSCNGAAMLLLTAPITVSESRSYRPPPPEVAKFLARQYWDSLLFCSSRHLSRPPAAGRPRHEGIPYSKDWCSCSWGQGSARWGRASQGLPKTDYYATQPSVAAEARHHARLVTRGSTHPGVILSRTVPPAPLLERQG